MVLVGLTAAVSVVLGALAGANLLRALADGFYVVGAAVLIGSFVLGMRGPMRAEWGEGATDDTPLSRGRLLGPTLPRMIRRTSPGERTDARRNSIALFLLGIVFIFIGSAFDPTRHPF